MIGKRTILATPGTTQVYHPSLLGVTILGVKRSGLGFNRTTGTPTNQQYQYIGGRIIFDAANPFNLGETVWVLYQN